MSNCGQRYLPLCSIPKLMNRDGYTGPNAKIYVPFCGLVFASGATFTPTNSTIPQSDQLFMSGVKKPGVGPVGFCAA